MCINPTFLVHPDGREDPLQVGCRVCWLCRKNRVNDLVGRCIAESVTASQTLAVTLTYNRNAGAHAAVLVYKDFQDFMKRLRKAGYIVRYIVAGEYGSKKARAHWHAILFVYGKTLNIVDEPDLRGPFDIILPRFKDDPWARIDWQPWSAKSEGRGFAYFQHPDYEGFRYVLKYVLKDQLQDVSVTHLAMSKKPPLGYFHFQEMARLHAVQGLVPQSAYYSFSDVRDALGRFRKFYLQGRMREIYLETLADLWTKLRPNQPLVGNEWFTERMAKLDPEQIDDGDFDWEWHLEERMKRIRLDWQERFGE